MEGTLLRRAVLLAAATVLALLCDVAWPSEGTLRVAVRVRASVPAPRSLDRIPLPTGATPLTANAFGGSYAYQGSPALAAQFYEATMAVAGFRRIRGAGDESLLVWENDEARAEVGLGRVLGPTETTRITITVSARPGRPARS